MSNPIRFAAPIVALLIGSMAVSGCGGAAAPTGVATSPAVTPSPTPDPAAFANYAEAMCRIFPVISMLDPRLTAVRETAEREDDMTSEEAEMAALSEILLVVVTDLQAVPDWGPGRALRYQLLTSLHAILATLRQVGRDPSAPDAAADISDMPFIATDALDRAMNEASLAGLQCAAG